MSLLHEFLRSYNRDSAYERIGSFDLSGEYDDENDDECGACDDRRTPYCIARCSNNDGQFEPEDCMDFRTEQCYSECGYNGDGCPYKRPCDFCKPKNENQCFLGCVFNQEWEIQDPCEECEEDGCENCPYAGKAARLGRELKTAEPDGDGEGDGESEGRGSELADAKT